jgi:DNA (cytosine-5)-methyltransferase 1
MRLLDLFCGAGGAGAGYTAAGFEVTGVDIARQPRYPGRFIQADVMTLNADWLAAFDAIHASPPCQGYSVMRHAPGATGAPRLIAEVRTMLEATGRHYIIENVEGAASEMRSPVLLCGSMFEGLEAEGCQLRRHRLFETNWPLAQPMCSHDENRPVVGVYGGHARRRAAKHGGRGTKDVWVGGHKTAAAAAMGIDWMTLTEMSEAIPPAYTKFIGDRLRPLLLLRKS